MKAQIPLFVLAVGSLAAESQSRYSSDVQFLRQHTAVIELTEGDAAVALAPAYQGRVMTSTTAGASGYSFGWLNQKVIARGIVPEAQAAGKLESHIYVFGGEERFWLGPEGGQFGIFFPPGATFDFAHWKTPPPLDTEAFEVLSSSATHAEFQKNFSVANHSGTRFEVAVTRSVRLLPRSEVASLLGVPLSDSLKLVAYETTNRLTNRGTKAWTPESGLLSIWLLGMYQPSPQTVVAIPIRQGDAAQLGPEVNDAYFGKVPAERLKLRDGVLYFKGDGQQRGKIGIPPRRSLGVAGSYSGDSQALTLVLYTPPKEPSRYVNSAWEQQKDPFSGDVINSYNDGSPAPGEAPLGPFYELETSSPAAALEPAASITHRQTTIHFTGDAATMDAVANKQLHTSLKLLKEVFTPGN